MTIGRRSAAQTLHVPAQPENLVDPIFVFKYYNTCKGVAWTSSRRSEGILAADGRTATERKEGYMDKVGQPRPGKRILRVRLNGRWREDAVAENQLLVDYLRETAGLTGTKTGCDGGECGACTVLLDGEAVPSCITLATRCEGRSVETIEGLADGGRLHRLQRAFHEKLGAQCGFCTPGMIMAAEGLLRRRAAPTEEEIRTALSGNLCRCTGYVKIIESVRAAADS
jgi:4-hydroxybenzoyl-CoA reductase subunit gamma